MENSISCKSVTAINLTLKLRKRDYVYELISCANSVKIIPLGTSVKIGEM